MSKRTLSSGWNVASQDPRPSCGRSGAGGAVITHSHVVRTVAEILTGWQLPRGWQVACAGAEGGEVVMAGKGRVFVSDELKYLHIWRADDPNARDVVCLHPELQGIQWSFTWRTCQSKDGGDAHSLIKILGSLGLMAIPGESVPTLRSFRQLRLPLLASGCLFGLMYAASPTTSRECTKFPCWLRNRLLHWSYK